MAVLLPYITGIAISQGIQTQADVAIRSGADLYVSGRQFGLDVPLPAGGFYLWFEVGDAWEFTERLVKEGGALVSPGDFYGDAGVGWVRVAVVQPDERIDLVARRLGVA